MKHVLIAIAALLVGCTQIDTGNVGVETTLGKVDPTPLPPGVYETVFKSVYEVTTKEIAIPIVDAHPKSRDNLTMADVDVDIYYKTMPSAVPGLMIKYQGDLVRHGDVVSGGTSDYVVAFNRVLREAREAVYSAVSEMDAITIHTKRAELADLIRAKTQAGLDWSDSKSFVVTAVNVRSLQTDTSIENAIRARAETDQAIERKRKEIELARAEAERQLVEAEGTAKANQAISASLTDDLVRLKLAEIQRETAEKLAAKAGNTVLLGGSATPLISPRRRALGRRGYRTCCYRSASRRLLELTG